MKQTIRNMYLKDKKVLVRLDYNVPIKNSNIIDDTKIVKSLETINYLLSQNCSIIIMSHLGRIKTEEDKIKNTLLPVIPILEKYLSRPIKFANDILSSQTQELAHNLQPGQILLLENTRFLDLPEAKESTYNDEVAKYLASLADVFIMDAFASAHRAHTSVIGPAKYLPSAIGFQVEKEMAILDSLQDAQKPFTVLMGGAKVDDKLPIIKNLLPKCNHLLLSGALANSFLSTLGLNIGASLKTENPQIKAELKKLLITYKNKFALPLDAIVESSYANDIQIKNINELSYNDIIKDIGTLTVYKYSKIINQSKTIFVNGTAGIYEEKEFANGTNEIFKTLKNCSAKVVIGGGDTTSALNALGYTQDFENVLSGGGASLEYLANQNLPGIEAINDMDNIEVLEL